MEKRIKANDSNRNRDKMNTLLLAIGVILIIIGLALIFIPIIPEIISIGELFIKIKGVGILLFVGGIIVSIASYFG